MTRVALVIGASRGIGRQTCITLAQQGWRVGVAAKSQEDNPKLPGTIFSVAREIEALTGGETKAEGQEWKTALPIVCDVRSTASIEEAVQKCLQHFGRLDYVVYNAGAIWWATVEQTDNKRFDLLNEVNMRGSYNTVRTVLPIFKQQKSGRILIISPPIYSRFFRGKVGYAMTKVGMTVLVHGLAEELKDTGVAITALWPATAIESQVSAKMKAKPELMRKATIFADAVAAIGDEPADRLNGAALIDEDYLREYRGLTDADFVKYRSDPATEPPRLLPKKFPSLLVAEQDEPGLHMSSVAARL
jgi:NAD(P)-dependent dehydrogenase (short-subunit alcohol dehydrogenase family)